MKSTFVFLLYIATVFGATIHSQDDQIRLASNIYGLQSLGTAPIVGGSSPDIEQFPFIVSLQRFGNHHCGGSIIFTNRILTAAHCTASVPANTISIRAGSANNQNGGQFIPVLRSINHPSFSESTVDSDISVLILQWHLQLGPRVQIIKLPNQHENVNVGAMGLVAGWGAMKEGGTSSNILQYVDDIKTVTNQECNLIYGGAITDTMLCAGYMEGGRGPCQMDSGGPFVINQTVIGVVSWGMGCARPGYPTIYARVSVFRNWVDNAV